MITDVINFKVPKDLKKEAQKTASDLGLTLTDALEGFLRNFVREKSITFSTKPAEEPSEYLLNSLKESEADIKAGRVVSFSNPDDALKFLDKMIDNDEKHSKN